jgi:nicotinamidase-related amidase
VTLNKYNQTANFEMVSILGREIPQTLEEIIDPKHTALVIHDMQNDPCNPETPQYKYMGPIDCYTILPRVLKLREAARKAGVLVMYTQYTNQPEWRSTSDFQIYKMKEKFLDSNNSPPQSSVYGTWGWEIIDELKPGKDETQIFKYRRDTFIGTNFDIFLHGHGIKTIVSCGIALEVGIQPTAVTASQMDYFPVVPKDAVSGRHQNYMDEAMKLLERTVIVTESQKIIDAWEKSSTK